MSTDNRYRHETADRNASYHKALSEFLIGYGDVYPITTLGKLTAALIAVVGIGLFALPAGILGSAFVELREQQKAEKSGVCPHCGRPMSEPHED